MVPEKSVLPCGMYEKLQRKAGLIATLLFSSEVVYASAVPSVGLMRARRSRMSVVLPAPVSPRIAVKLPGRKSWEKCLMMVLRLAS